MRDGRGMAGIVQGPATLTRRAASAWSGPVAGDLLPSRGKKRTVLNLAKRSRNVAENKDDPSKARNLTENTGC
jgi:hypothetical protein